MWTVVLVVSILAVVFLVAVRLLLAGKAPRHEPQAEVLDPEVAAAELPDPGEPTPHRADGTLPPGSRDDRRRKGRR